MTAQLKLASSGFFTPLRYIQNGSSSRLNLLIGAGFALHLPRALVGFAGRLMGDPFGGVLGLVPGFLGAALDAIAGVFGGVLGAVTGVFHVLFKAWVGARLGDDRNSNGKNSGDESGAEELDFHSFSHAKRDSEMSDRVVAG